MIPTEFEYLSPKSVEEALRLMATHGADARLLAGGHSLIPLMKLRLAAPRFVVDLGRVPGLNHIKEQDGKLEIGAMATHATVEHSELLRRSCPLLCETAAEIGDVQVRNCGTIGGSLAHADPAADYPAAVLALDAEILVQGPNGPRTIPIAKFFLDLMTTALAPGELITGIRVSPLPERSGAAYKKVRHPASGFALVGVAVVVTLGAGGEIADARVGVTGMAVKPFRAHGVEKSLRGKSGDAATLRAAAEKVARGVDVLADIHASSEYRQQLARVYCRRALVEALARIKN